MTIDSIIVDKEARTVAYLKQCLNATFPEIRVRGEASCYHQADRLIKSVSPSLVFADMDTMVNESVPADQPKTFETVYLSSRPEDAIHAIQEDVCGFILKPLEDCNVISSVRSAIRKISKKEDTLHVNKQTSLLPHKQLIGIPTMEGIDFLSVSEIVRCEGLQKCTRIVATTCKDVISSYSIGEFVKLLSDHGFFLCHKSHLINLMYVKKCTREGFIILDNQDAIPLARRKRAEFLQQLNHL